MTGRFGLPIARESASQSERATVRKPRALTTHSVVMPFAPASPAEASRIAAGLAELTRLGWQVAEPAATHNDGYFAGTMTTRRNELRSALERDDVEALVGTRGGYGSNYLLDDLHISTSANPKIILGFSDLTSLQIYLWQRFQWVTFYGPMLAAGLDAGLGAPQGYDQKSLLAALQNTVGGWSLDLQGEQLTPGEAHGRVLGGCLTLVETTIGTQWDLQTDDAILVLEDRGMKPWQVDRALMHLKQAGKFTKVRGIVLGDFPECETPVAGSPTVRDVCQRILVPLGVPIVFGAPIGHTMRPMLTVPLGVKARLSTKGAGVLEILEPAVVS
ncbi:MAG: muramoyltetrapeptide carboxypeptidase [Acidobacteriaceae bacterium]|jgi:muramoyltetrapeptide carboxypeptidase|nr:muramoyltetrapeptide carboxypeptidase [Acidobacteriaceae bacterium]